MSDYTPSINDVRALYILATPAHRVSIAEAQAEFNRAISKIKADALREAADEVGAWGPACIPAAQSLRAKADRLTP